MSNEMPIMQAVDEHGAPADLSIVHEAGVAFDPTQQHLDLTKDEKRRVTALMMAITACKEWVIREADYLREAGKLARKEEGPALQPATIDAMVDAAIKFDTFIADSAVQNQDPTKDQQTLPQS